MRKLRKMLLIMLVLCPLVVTAQAQEAGEPSAWWQNRVFYEIFVRSFYDSDGDGIGDLQGIISKLDYLNDGDPTTSDDLGVTGIWLMPVTEGPTYHGYHVTDYRAIEADYGTIEDFQQLADEAHERGIAVIVDLVMNHTASDHPWFVAAQEPDSEYEDWYIWSEEDPGYLGPWGQTVWHPIGDRFYYGIFVAETPDLNYRNPEVTEAMQDIARFWIEEMGVDGFRLDAVKHMIEEDTVQANSDATHEWLTEFDNFIDSVDPDLLTVGEIFGDPINVVAEYVDEEVDIAFNFELASAMLESANSGSARSIRRVQAVTLNAFPQYQYAAFLTNHDQNRVMTELNGDFGKARVAASLLLTQPGVPFIYYGEEIGMTGAKPDERIRAPMQWTADTETAGFTEAIAWQPLADTILEGANVEAQDADADSLLNHYRALIQLRSAHPALASGAYTLVETDSRDVYAFARSADDETLLVVINLEDEPVSEYSLMLQEAGLDGFTSAEVLYADAQIETVEAVSAQYKPLPELPPQSTLVIQLS